ncbi:MAG: DNA/RNA non-specific endonuclease [Alistipes sp.]
MNVLKVIFKLFGRYFLLLTATLLLAASCSTDDEDAPYLRVFPTSMLFNAATPDANAISIEANGEWTIIDGVPAPQVDSKRGMSNRKVHVLNAPQGQSTLVVTMGQFAYTVTVTNLSGDKPKPDPDPTPSGEAVFGKSWAEMPAKLVKEGDYYYAYHMRADVPAIRNYTVCYSKGNMCPVWVAAPMHESYKGSSGRTDAYTSDPSFDFTQAGRWKGYTRGHMLGSSDRTVSRPTNEQVFYYSNIAPQLSDGFNQGNGAWNNLEELTDRQWCADTLYQVVGCYWANNNKKVDDTVIPTHYYKILLRTKGGNTHKSVANCSAAELKCAAFILEHKNQKGLKPNASMMKSVADLERMTGFTFFPNVPNAPKTTINAADWGL